MKKKIEELPQESTDNTVHPLQNNSSNLNRVTPTNSLVFLSRSSMPCEKKTALIRNHTVSCMEDDDTRSVAYRYLQNSRGELSTRNEAFMSGLFTIYAIFYFIVRLTNRVVSSNPVQEDGWLIFFRPSLLKLAFFLPNLPPNVCNMLRYRETKDSCENWLIQKLGNDDFQQIKKLSYNRESFFKINDLLDKTNISAALLKNIPSRFKEM